MSATFLLGAAAVLALAPTVGRQLRPAAAGPSDGASAGAATPAVVVAAASAPARAPITARPVSVSETRERAVGDTQGQTSSTSFFTGLRVKLRLEGPAAAGASKVGRLKITEAADDAGTDLRDKDQLKWGEQFQDVSRFGQSDKDKAAGGFEYEMKLGLPARRAGAIAQLKGELQVLSGGEEKTVSVPAVRTLAGKAVEDPALKAAGIMLKILPSPAGQKNSVQAELSGDFDAIKDVKVIGPGGINLMAGAWWSESNGKRTVSYMLSQPADDAAAKLELRVAVGQKKLTVPVELANLPLP